MLFVVRDGVQDEMDECLIRCVATSSEEETNSGINSITCLSVCRLLICSRCRSVWTSYPRVCWS